MSHSIPNFILTFHISCNSSLLFLTRLIPILPTLLYIFHSHITSAALPSSQPYQFYSQLFPTSPQPPSLPHHSFLHLPFITSASIPPTSLIPPPSLHHLSLHLSHITHSSTFPTSPQPPPHDITSAPSPALTPPLSTGHDGWSKLGKHRGSGSSIVSLTVTPDPTATGSDGNLGGPGARVASLATATGTTET